MVCLSIGRFAGPQLNRRVGACHLPQVSMPSPTQGWILLCNNSTQQEYIRNNLVGLKEQYLPRLASLEPGDPVLLYNFESAHLAALFFATAKPALDMAARGWLRLYLALV